ncbi:hypothetical protein QBC39DRAFT_96199 [Podospora conica]|nr:hypothetical protein QBC39DRAFT_96199 [Schizothecium conicum]
MQQHFSSSPSLSSPPSALSEPASPTRLLNAGRAGLEMDEIVVDPGSAPRFGIMQSLHNPPPAANVPLTAAGLPRKKPGRKPGSTVKPKVAPDGTVEPPKAKRPRKPRDPNAPPIQRKRKNPPTDPPRPTPPEPTYVPAALKRESLPASMQNILNDDPPPKPQPSVPVRMFDPIRGNYDPIRESMITRDPYGTGPLGSPRAPSQTANRASASPSIASLVDPPSTNHISPSASYYNPVQSRFQEPSSVPASPSHPARSMPQIVKPALAEAKRPPPPPPAPKPDQVKTTSFTSMSAIPPSAAAALANGSSGVLQSKKVSSIVQQDRETHKKASSNTSSPRINSTKDSLPHIPGSDRSILDFGKATPGEEMSAPSIVLHIPLNGEPNKYVNFMRMAEETYGWDALHPRLAANRERKARIAAASAALEKEKNGSGDTGDEMDEDLQSDADNSNVEMGGMGAPNGNGTGAANGPTSGPDGAPAAKPARKKRNFKEDEYDKDDDFVDDSELLWEEQAAASRDGFFVYSGPLIPEQPKAPVTAPTRGRGRGRGGGPGSRGGRGGAARGEGTGRGRGGGPGSRGGSVTRKPRITKLEKEQRDREKAEREKAAQTAGASAPYPGLVTSAQGAAVGT